MILLYLKKDVGVDVVVGVVNAVSFGHNVFVLLMFMIINATAGNVVALLSGCLCFFHFNFDINDLVLSI